MWKFSIIFAGLVGLIYGSFSTDDTCQCGISNRKRIVNGEDAGENEFPWQVYFEVKRFDEGLLKSYGCGGTIISANTILTAAHCLHGGENLDQIDVWIGGHRLFGFTENNNIIGVGEIHPSYNPESYDYDYAIITTRQRMTFSPKVGPACLPTTPGRGEEYEGVSVVVSGWGVLKFRGKGPDVLQKTTLQTLSNNDCCNGTNFEWPMRDCPMNPEKICTFTTGTDACQGDSGGPVVHEEKGGYFTVIGVVSYGYGCAWEKHPGRNARVTHALEWIHSKMEGSTCARPDSTNTPVTRPPPTANTVVTSRPMCRDLDWRCDWILRVWCQNEEIRNLCLATCGFC